MSSDRTKLVTIKLEAPSQAVHSQPTDREDDLAAVLRWLGEASAAGWRVTAHIPSTRLALVVSTVDAHEPEDGEDDDDATIVDSVAEADSSESDSEGDEEDQDDDSEEDTAPPPPTKAVTFAPARASSMCQRQPTLPLPRLRSPSRRR